MLAEVRELLHHCSSGGFWCPAELGDLCQVTQLQTVQLGWNVTSTQFSKPLQHGKDEPARSRQPAPDRVPELCEWYTCLAGGTRISSLEIVFQIKHTSSDVAVVHFEAFCHSWSAVVFISGIFFLLCDSWEKKIGKTPLLLIYYNQYNKVYSLMWSVRSQVIDSWA